ncbi:MAG: tetratricopeptide repeat protein, partial [Flavobacteriaceae bacterium]|nr:tetratricopeptide repeat protein [Flavobacteriaceae bacterium]
LKKDRNFAYAYDMVGISYRRMNDYKKALKYYNKSLKLDPKGRMPLLNKPIAYALMEDYQSSIEGYLEFIDVFPDDPEGFYGIGRIYHVLGDYENALDNMMKSYVLYNEIESPYARDAEANLSLFYKELKEKNQLDLFTRLAKKYKIEIGE